MNRALFVTGLALALTIILMTCAIAKTESVNIKCDKTECIISKDDLEMLLNANLRAAEKIIDLREESKLCNKNQA